FRTTRARDLAAVVAGESYLLLVLLFCFLVPRGPPRSPLFPYTTLFRSRGRGRGGVGPSRRAEAELAGGPRDAARSGRARPVAPGRPAGCDDRLCAHPPTARAAGPRWWRAHRRSSHPAGRPGRSEEHTSE